MSIQSRTGFFLISLILNRNKDTVILSLKISPPFELAPPLTLEN